MGLLDVCSWESGIASATLSANEADASSIGASASCQVATTAQYLRGPFSAYALVASTGASSVVAYHERDWGSDEATIYGEVYVCFNAVPAAITYFLSIYDSTPAVILDIGVNASGNWIVKNAGDATVYTSTGPAVVAGRRYRLELKLVSDAAAGTIDVKFDQTLEPGLSGLTGKNTKPGNLPRRVRLGVTVAQASAGARGFDDWVLRNDDWCGDALVKTLVMQAMDSGGNNWTITDGGSTDGWQTQDERPWTAAPTTDLIKSSTANQEERIKFAPFAQTATGVTILGAQPVIRHKRTTAGSAAAVVVDLTSGASHGTTKSLDAGGSTFTTLRGALQTTDPATSSAWTVSGLNGVVLRMVHDAGTNEAQICASLVYVAYLATGGQSVSDSKGTKTYPRRKGNVSEYDDPSPYPRRGRQKHGAAS